MSRLHKLDTLAVALHEAGCKTDAAYVASRLIRVCELIGGEKCRDELSRAYRHVANAIQFPQPISAIARQCWHSPEPRQDKRPHPPAPKNARQRVIAGS